MDTDAEALIHLNDSLKSIQKLKVSINSLFDCLGNGPSEDQENTAFVRSIQHRLINMDAALTDLETSGNLLPTVNPSPSINSMAIALEPEDDSYETFYQLINSYTWNKRVQEYSNCVTSLLKENQLKRTGPASGSLAKRPRKNHPPETHNVQPTTVDQIIAKLSQNLSTKHPDTSLHIERPIGISTVLVVSIAKTMKAVIIFRGLLTERIIVKGYGESTKLENGQVDMWGESKHKVFQLVTHCAQAAMLHFQTPIFPEMSVYSLVNWLHTYHNLFTGECNYCQKILNNHMPPTGRGYEKTASRYHPQCASSQAR